MKKNVFEILVLAFSTLIYAANTDFVTEPRDTTTPVKYLMPGWLDMSGANSAEFTTTGSTEITLDDDAHVNYLGTEYSSLSVYNDCRIAFGKYTENLDLLQNPFVRPIVAGFYYKKGSFKWKKFYDKNSSTGSTAFTVVEISDFSKNNEKYSLQVLFYADGEVQVQLRQHPDGKTHTSRDSWAIPSIFNGYTFQTIDEDYPSYMPIVKNGKVREGWIAKGFDKYNSMISSIYVNSNNRLVFEMGTDTYAGALIAYDYSREHPVVGSFNSISIGLDYSYTTIPTSENRLYYWYFDEIEGSQTTSSNYPYMIFENNQVNFYRNSDGSYKHVSTVHEGSVGSGHITLNQYSYNNTWLVLNNNDAASVQSTNRNSNAVLLRNAPAFKFQKTFSYDVVLAFDSISYYLKERPTVRFLPPVQPYVFTKSSNSGGQILVKNLKGNAPYRLFENQNVRAEIRASVGSEIKKVSLNGVVIFQDGDFIPQSSLGSYAEFAQYLNVAGYDKTEMLVFDANAKMDMNLDVEFGACSGRKLPRVSPQIIRTTKFYDPETALNGRRSASAVIKGAFGETVQSQDSLVAYDDIGQLIPHNYVISAYYTDDYGQKNYSTSDFVHDTTGFEYLDMACQGCIIKANDYYDGSDVFDKPNALNVAYVQYDKKYGEGSGSNGTAYGIADASFDNFQEQAESWSIPVFSDEDFLSESMLNTSAIKEKYKLSQSSNAIAKYMLTISRDAEGRFQQAISNSKGQTVSTWNYIGGCVHTVKYEYDKFDRLKKTVPDKNNYLATTYRYDENGQVVETTSPDRGTMQTSYDKFGRARFVRNGAQRKRGTFSAKIYDNQGRDIASVEVKDSTLFNLPETTLNPSDYILYNRTIYGKPSLDTLTKYGLNVDAALATAIFSNMRNIREKDVGATFAYDALGNVTVVKMASYDRIGRKDRQWVVYAMAGMPAVELSYTYNSADELVHSVFAEWDGATFVSRAERNRSYDENGRLLSILDENGDSLAAYEYSRNGNVKSKSYYDKGSLVYKKTIIRDVHGRPTKIVYENGSVLLYQDTLTYETPLAGRVSEAEHSWKNVNGHGDETRTGKYTYDEDGRLTKVEAPLSGEYRYNGPYGQMSYKKEGDSVIGYAYLSPDKYRPSGYDINGRSPSGSAEYFKYDDAGNVWYDRHAQVAYKLNAAGLPEVAYVLNAHQDALTLKDVDDGNVTGVAETMRMAYDEGGSRIWTGFEVSGSNDEEYAMMPGVGTYYVQRVTGSENFTLKRMDLVAGGYRDMNSGVAYFPVTDAQGNVRGYASTQGLQSAYDYYAYGSSETLVHSADEDNKRWQGKEEDEPIRKLYFGARYFDPFFGMWMSPDPAGQFVNPYTYGGDPMNYVDPNGEWVQIVVGAIIGAVVGTVSGIVQCTAPGGGSCGKSVGVGFVGGAAVGAAAGAGGVAAAEAVGAGLGGAIAGGAAGGAIAGAGNYANQAFVNGNFDAGDMLKATGTGAALGAVGGGIAGAALSPSHYAIFNNMFSSTLSSSLSYAVSNTHISGDGISWSGSWNGFAGAVAGGLVGGVIPGYQPVGDGMVKNIAFEIIYSSVRGAAVGYLSRGIGSVFSDGNWDNDAAIGGAARGAINGGLGAIAKIGLMGYAIPKSEEQMRMEEEYAKEHNLVIGPYGSVRRSGGVYGWFHSNKLNSPGITLGRNLLVMGNDQISRHEGIHYLQQVQDGTIPFYAKTAKDYMSIGWKHNEVYFTSGTYEYEAEHYAKNAY